MSVAGVQMIQNDPAVTGEIPSDAPLQASVMDALQRSAQTADNVIVLLKAKSSSKSRFPAN